MKKLLLLLSFILSFSISNAQNIYGSVLDMSSQAVANKTVYLQSDSNTNYSAQQITSSGGWYNFSNVPALSPGGFYQIYLYDCNQNLVQQTIYTNTDSLNFTICNSTACSAGFAYYIDSINANEVYFIDQSTGNPTSWNWYFGDGTSSTAQNPSHVYNAPGTYTAALFISSANCSDSVLSTVTVLATNCSADFSYTGDSINPANFNTVYFSDLSVSSDSIISYSWDFGDGNSSNQKDPTHTYSSSGKYFVTLIINTNSCADTITKAVEVGLLADFSTYYYSTNIYEKYFNNSSIGSPTSFFWDFDDGNTSTLEEPVHTYSSAGYYNVKLVVSKGNMTDSTTLPVIVGNAPSPVSISGAVFNSNSTNVDVYLYDLQANIIDSTIANPFYFFANVDTGSYKVYAVPDTGLTGYIPTYYGDMPNWDSANVIVVDSSLTGININLIPYVINPGGPGSISGNVYGQTKTDNDILVHLYDIDMNPVKSSFCDANGSYEFTNLAYGDYIIRVEIPGKSSETIAVTLDQQSPNSEGNNFEINGDNIEVITSGIKLLNKDEISIYPNPANKYLNISSETNFVRVHIYSTEGRLILDQSFINKIDIQHLSKGIYHIRFINNENVYIKSFIKN